MYSFISVGYRLLIIYSRNKITMEQVTVDIDVIAIKEDKTDVHEVKDGSLKHENFENVAGIQNLSAHSEQITWHDAKNLDIEENIDELQEHGDDHGTASIDSRVLGCLSTTDAIDKVNRILTVDPKQDVYDMNHKYRGHALLINNETFSIKLRRQGLSNRDGSSVDDCSMKTRLSELGFAVHAYPDLTANQMRRVCSKVAAKDHSECDCFVCVILSHGEEGVVYGTDKPVEIKELANLFKGDSCPSLIGKPKIFIIQACRGYQTDPGVNVNVADAKYIEEQGKSGIVKLPIEADFLYAYSTIPGYYSWRNGANGSWFIQALSEALKGYGKTMEIRKLLTIVNRNVAYNFQSFNPENEDFHKMKQVPCITSMLTKDVYFSTTKKRKLLF